MVTTGVYCAVMCINGGMVGAFGPSLECFQRSTGLTQGELGSAVLQNRLAKLGGTIVWASYASLLQRSSGNKGLRLNSHVAMAANLALLAAGCAVLGFTTSGLTLQVMMLFSGASYGFTDSACNMLTLWLWQDDARRQRSSVALINAFFTVGAFVTPMLVAGSLHYLNDTVWPAFHSLAALALVSAAFLLRLASPTVPKADVVTDAVQELEMEVVDDESSMDAPGVGRKSSPGTGSKRKGKVSDGEMDAVEGAGCIRCCRRWKVAILMFMTAVIGFFANGCEHAVATWLSAYGVRRCKLSEETMAIMTSNYWTAMATGRLVWALCSGIVPSAWPVLVVNGGCCLCSTVLLAQTSESMLWLGALGVGVGVSSTFPALITLLPECNVEMQPARMATLQLCASAGEMLCPFFLGIIFQFRRYEWFGPVNFWQQAFSLSLLTAVWISMRFTRRSSAP